MALSAFAAPIMEGKLAQWREFIREIGDGGSRHAAYVASRQAMGVRERAFLQPTPIGDMVIVTLEGDDAAGAMAKFAGVNDAFTQWFVAQVLEIHGFDCGRWPRSQCRSWRSIVAVWWPTPDPRRAWFARVSQ